MTFLGYIGFECIGGNSGEAINAEKRMGRGMLG